MLDMHNKTLHCFAACRGRMIGPRVFEIQPSSPRRSISLLLSFSVSLLCAVSRRLDAALSALEDGCRDGERLHLRAQLEQLPLVVSPLRRLAHRHIDDEG